MPRLGQHYLAHQAENVFYRGATFFSTAEVEQRLSDTGFTNPIWLQTLSKTLEETHEIEPLRAGYGKERRRYSLCALAAGILVAVLIVLSK